VRRTELVCCSPSGNLSRVVPYIENVLTLLIRGVSRYDAGTEAVATKGRAAMKSFFGNGWRYLTGLWAFFPFLTMLAVHRLLGLSDAFMAKPKPSEPFWPVYNIVMVIAFYAGIGSYLTYLWVTDSDKPDK
jgi:hypothetical protein